MVTTWGNSANLGLQITLPCKKDFQVLLGFPYLTFLGFWGEKKEKKKVGLKADGGLKIKCGMHFFFLQIFTNFKLYKPIKMLIADF